MIEQADETRAPFGPDYGFGLYVHWPYCTRICPYCDFNVYAAKDRNTDSLVETLIADIAAHKPRMPKHGALDTIFFGGGTPSLMMPEQVSKIVEAARANFGLKADAEITLEANPNDILGADLEGLKRAGVNRVSIGVQSLRDDALIFLGRDHDVTQAKVAVARALSVFSSVSVDLIYARPGQTFDAWQAELSEAIMLGVHHMSLYELTIEQRTAFGQAEARGELIQMGEEAQARMYEITQAVMSAAGMPAYEISNHAISDAHKARHNMIYWSGGDWIGVGPGAHGRISVGGKRYATLAQPKPGDYMANVQALGSGWGGADVLTQMDVAREMVAMGLRSNEGLEIGRVEALSGEDISRDKIATFAEQGWLEMSPGRITLTPAGSLLADALSAELAP